MAETVKKIKKSTIFIGVIAVVALIVFIVYKFFGPQIVELVHLLEHGDQDELSAYLASQSTFHGYFMLWVICVLQVVSIFFPGMVIHITGAFIYKWWKSFLICWCGFVSENALVFAFARMFGMSISLAFESKEKKQNWLVEKINNGNQVFVVAIACMIPGIPNGIIPYLAARTSITMKDFVTAVACSSWIQILLNCIAGHFWMQGEYGFMILAIAIEVAIIVIVAKNRDKLLKQS